MSLDVRIKKSFGDYTLDVAFAGGDETLGFLGASGCGKSLTLRCIAGIETPDEGRIVVNGKVFFDSEQKINLTPQQRKTALLFQNYMLFPNLTVADNIGAGIGREVRSASASYPRSWSVSACAVSGSAIRPSSPVASSNAWPWPVCWRRGRASSCWTSPSAPWTLT